MSQLQTAPQSDDLLKGFVEIDAFAKNVCSDSYLLPCRSDSLQNCPPALGQHVNLNTDFTLWSSCCNH